MTNFPTYYRIDMELCEMDLDAYIQQDFPFSFSPVVAESSSPHVDLSLKTRLQCIQKIVNDIVSGVSYIHKKNEVHRDLKPRNGICKQYVTDQQFSIIAQQIYGRSQTLV
jgi:serine/threonine protein kinase